MSTPARAPADVDVLPLVQALLARATTSASGETFLADTLDHVVELIGADRGLIMIEHAGGARWWVDARDRALTAAEREVVSGSCIRQVCDAPEPFACASPSAGIHTALLAPLRGPSAAPADVIQCGALYVDFRAPAVPPGPAALGFVALAAQLISVVLERTQRLDSARARLQRGPAGALPGLSLDELLAYETLAHVRAELALAAQTTDPVVVRSVAGAGKSAVALALAHAGSTGPVVRAALASLEPAQHAAVLFGEAGRATGLVPQAAGGTLILDDLDVLSPSAQRGVLDLVHTGTYVAGALDAGAPVPIRLRVIVTVTDRSDFVDALGGHRIELLPLSHRRADLPALAAAITRRYAGNGWDLDADAMKRLCDERIRWGGNLRQLEELLASARLRALMRDNCTHTIAAADLHIPELGEPLEEGAVHDHGTSWTELEALRADLTAREDAVIAAALAKHGGNHARAATELGLPCASLTARVQSWRSGA